jgi:hypothetical protein
MTMGRTAASAWVPVLAGLAAILLIPAGTARAADARYVGASKCRMCHFAEHKSWAETKMARSFELLKPGVAAEAKTKAGLDPARDYTTDAGCLACHTTGHGRPGGFAGPAATPDLAGVSCEACHGAASEYLEEGRMTLANRDYKRADLIAAGLVVPTAGTCTSLCHNEKSPTHRPFDYAQAKSQGLHAIIPLKGRHD